MEDLMDFAIPQEVVKDLEQFTGYLRTHLEPELAGWYKKEAIPREFFRILGKDGWLGFTLKNGEFLEQSYLKQTILLEHLAKISPGVAVAIMAHISLGMVPLYLFGSEKQKKIYLPPALRGETLLCLGNTEHKAGSDVASIAMQAEKAEGGWILKGTKAYVTNGAISDLAMVTAVSDPDASRNRRLSMFLVDLSSTGVSRKKLNKIIKNERRVSSSRTPIRMDTCFLATSLGGCRNDPPKVINKNRITP